MTYKEIYIQLYASVAQGILEAKHGIIGEIVPEVLADDAIHITDALIERLYKKFEWE